MEPSVVVFNDKSLNKLSKIVFFIYRKLRLIRVTERRLVDKNNDIEYESTNFTIINLYLVIMGPTREDKLTTRLLIIQVTKPFNSFY
jgi:hypothetical protein